MKTETKPKPKVPKIPAAPDSRAPALAVEAWPVDRPKPYAKNPRRNDAAVEKVAASIREFGWAQPIVVDGDGVIIIGHTRLKAAKKLGLKTVPVLVRADLTPEQVAALRLADNKTAELAEWDEPLLAAELDALVGAVDMEQFGFDLSAPELTEGQTDEDAVPEPPPEPVSRRGAVYALGRHRLMCGDSTSAEDCEILMHGEKADIIFTDPPYGVGFSGTGAALATSQIQGDLTQTLIPFAFVNGLDFTKDKARLYYCGSQTNWDMYSKLFMRYTRRFVTPLIWVKNGFTMRQNGYHNGYEVIYFGFKQGGGGNDMWFGGRGENEASDVWKISRDPTSTYSHPTQKPVEIPARAINNSCPPGGIVLDLFLGSGSTAIAAEKTGRVCYGMELDPIYCDVIRKRWAEFVHGEGCDWQTLAPEVDA